jgi:hypothetical protein
LKNELRESERKTLTSETFYHKLFRVTHHPKPTPTETMSIEIAIQELTAAIKESSTIQRELLNAVLSNTAIAAVPAAEPKAVKTKKEKPAPVEPEPEPTPEPTPEPAAEPEAPTPTAEAPVEDELATVTIPELRNLIKAKFTEANANRAKFDDLRKEFGIDTIKDLADDKIAAFHKEVLTW